MTMKGIKKNCKQPKRIMQINLTWKKDWHKMNSITCLVFKHKNKVYIVILPKLYHMVN